MKGKSKMTTTSAHRAENIPVASRRDAESDFKAAFEEHWSWVYATLCRVVGDEDEAEDLALEVFYRLHEKPPREQSGLASWLYRVAINMGLNALRARQRRRRYEEAAGVQELQQAAPADPADEVERRERARHVRQVLSQMKPKAAQLLILRHSGLSYVEIAAILEVASGSVGTLLARAEKEFGRRYRALEVSDETP